MENLWFEHVEIMPVYGIAHIALHGRLKGRRNKSRPKDYAEWIISMRTLGWTEAKGSNGLDQ